MRTFIPNTSAETMALYDWMREKPIGYQAAYAELSEIARGDVRTVRHGNLITVLKRLQSVHGHIWGTVRGVGLKRLNEDQIIDSAESGIKRGMRASGRAKRKLEVIEYASLSEVSKRRHDIVKLQAAVAQAVLGKRGADRIAKMLPENRGTLPDLTETLKFFTGKS